MAKARKLVQKEIAPTVVKHFYVECTNLKLKRDVRFEVDLERWPTWHSTHQMVNFVLGTAYNTRGYDYETVHRYIYNLTGDHAKLQVRTQEGGEWTGLYKRTKFLVRDLDF